MKNLLICNSCGWVHFKLSELEVINSGKVFKEYFDNLSKENKIKYYKKEVFTIDEYIKQHRKCIKCGNSNKNFREESSTDKIQVGITIQGIINEL